MIFLGKKKFGSKIGLKKFQVQKAKNPSKSFRCWVVKVVSRESLVFTFSPRPQLKFGPSWTIDGQLSYILNIYVQQMIKVIV